MNLLRRPLSTAGEALLLLGGVLAVLLPVSPWNMPLVGRDSGVFLYAGWRILAGELPYRDVWDHKPPLIHYLDALGLALGGGSRWGVWVLEVVSLFIAAAVGFHLLKKAFGLWPAIYSLVLWLLTLTVVLQGGNLTTEYTLPLQFLALWLVYDAGTPSFPRGRWALIGALGVLAFFTKQTATGIWIAIAFYLVLTRLRSGQARRLMREMALLAAGAGAVTLAVLAFLASQGILGDFWDAAFRYNREYIVAPLLFQLQVMIAGVAPLGRAGLWQLAMVGWMLGAARLLAPAQPGEGWRPLWLVAVIAMPIEWVLAGIGGRAEPHYYMAFLPTLAVLTGAMFWVLLSQLPPWRLPRGVRVLLLGSLPLLLVASSLSDYRAEMNAYREQGNPAVVEYLQANTAPRDLVLLWGAETSVNFHARRKSPTRYVYHYPLSNHRYVNEAMILEFLDALLQQPPRLLIDTKPGFRPFLEFPIQSDAIQSRVATLRSRYRVMEEVGEWTIYERIEGMVTGDW